MPWLESVPWRARSIFVGLTRAFLKDIAGWGLWFYMLKKVLEVPMSWCIWLARIGSYRKRLSLLKAKRPVLKHDGIIFGRIPYWSPTGTDLGIAKIYSLRSESINYNVLFLMVWFISSVYQVMLKDQWSTEWHSGDLCSSFAQINLAFDKYNVGKLNNFTIHFVVGFHGDGSGSVCWQLECEKAI